MVGKIRFTIDQNGEVQLNVEGAQGKACEALTEPFEQMLGVTSKKTFKDSYFQETTNEGALLDGIGET